MQTREILFGERNWHVQRGCGRMVRKGDWVYLRDFTPGCYSFQMGDHATGAYAELLRLKAEGKLTPEQAEIFSTNRPPEQLFKVTDDPQQLKNLNRKYWFFWPEGSVMRFGFLMSGCVMMRRFTWLELCRHCREKASMVVPTA